jgi:uncharacterized RDD family membrane protein YckC
VIWRRLAAGFYDLLLLTAVYMVTTALLLFFTRGQAITPQDSAGLTYLLRALLVTVTVLYFGLSWTRTGQTLGMLAWKIRVERHDGSRLRWRDVVVRLGSATLSLLALGLGFLWILVDSQGRAWHDRLSATRIVRAA